MVIKIDQVLIDFHRIKGYVLISIPDRYFEDDRNSYKISGGEIALTVLEAKIFSGIIYKHLK